MAGWAWIAYDRGGDPVEQGLAPSRAVAAACVIRVFARSHAPRSPDDGEMTAYATGLTTVTDITFDNQGRLLATEFRGLLKGEEDASGRVMRLDKGRVVAGGQIPQLTDELVRQHLTV